MTAGDIGTVITVNAGGYNMTGSTAVLLVQLAAVPVMAHTRYTMTVDPGGLTAHYITNGTEFPVGGIYNFQLEVDSGADKFTSPSSTVLVHPLMTP